MSRGPRSAHLTEVEVSGIVDPTPTESSNRRKSHVNILNVHIAQERHGNMSHFPYHPFGITHSVISLRLV